MANIVDTQEQPIEMLDAGEARPWPVRVSTILLFLQALGLIGLSFYGYDPAVLQQDSDILELILIILSGLTRTIAFGALALLAVMAGFGFLGLWRTGWPTAILLQGLCLLVSLGLYLRSSPPYIFGLMGYCILMVIYLHHPEVQQAFQTKQLQESKWPEEQAPEERL